MRTVVTLLFLMTAPLLPSSNLYQGCRCECSTRSCALSSGTIITYQCASCNGGEYACCSDVCWSASGQCGSDRRDVLFSCVMVNTCSSPPVIVSDNYICQGGCGRE